MSLVFRRARPASTEVRSFVVPMSGTTDEGFVPDMGSAATSLQSIAVRSSVDLLASLTSELPLDVYRGTGPTRTKVTTPGYLQDPGGEGHGAEDWIYQALMSWLLRGNLYGTVIDWSSTGLFPTTVALHYPDDVRGDDSSGRLRWRVAGREVDGESFLHRRVNPVPGRVLGLSPVEFHAYQLGLSIASARFGAAWFRDGAIPGGLLTNEGELDATQAKVAKDRFMASLRGTREPAVLGNGWKYQQVQVAPNESQFLETQGFTEAQCARIFGPGVAEVLGYETGGSMTYANVVDRRADLLALTLNRWILRAERLLTAMLPRPQYVKLNRDALLQATTLQRYEAHKTAIGAGFKTRNEVRENEDLNPLPGGDTLITDPKALLSTTDGGNGNPA